MIRAITFMLAAFVLAMCAWAPESVRPHIEPTSCPMWLGTPDGIHTISQFDPCKPHQHVDVEIHYRNRPSNYQLAQQYCQRATSCIIDGEEFSGQ